MANTVNLNDLVTFARADVDKAQSAIVARAKLIDTMISAGYTFENTASYTAKELREGKVSNANVMFRNNLMFICAAAIKLNGKRLSDADLQRFMDDEVSNKTMLNGFMKGNVSGERTWKGDATSHMGKLRNDLKAREDAGKADDKASAARNVKTDTDAILSGLQAIYNRTFKADVTIKADPADVQKAMRAVATLLGATLSQPKGK
jgi:hypothetical protein